ncbi:rsbT co-antagonist protein RsbR [Streptomyces sp. LamerLS-316]|uniref:STAS domain-containing protein n=1 Tax=unclassified Streptomyces TaxID=2593676 RepID=UPI000823CC51|nr:STAS domain-containing protein [Streptomyces sp. LamerLS-316]MYQ40253.1 STAS domain-containing protein [Streptomyces sp. SID4921]SCK14206.1 rsbT co-antagonist protein RsbR [Streptomyces sp. LamerLS-316]
MTEQDIPARLVELLSAQQESLGAAWVENVSRTLRGRISLAELDRELRELYDALVAGLRAGGLDWQGDAFAEARALLAELSRARARQGFTPTETATSVLAGKDVLAPTEDTPAEDIRAYLKLSKLFDALGLFTLEVYARTREEIISAQAEQLMELSTPVVKLWDGVVAVPLVGTLDSARTQVVMEKLLQALVDTGSDQAIIDITGVPAVDTEVAQHLLKTVVAARLMGAECIISGIRPQIAQTIVALGIQFGDIVTKSSLADALKHALRGSNAGIAQPGGRA